MRKISWSSISTYSCSVYAIIYGNEKHILFWYGY